jgi:FkbM family methyltransferase
VLTDSATWQRIAALLPAPLTVVDIGARGGVEDQWAALGPHVEVYAFEPDDVECDRLNERPAQGATYIPLAVGSSSGRRSFYVTQDPFCSSLFPPIERLARERPRLAEMRIERVITIQTRTIDDWMREGHISRLDHLKLDAQGAELEILEGAAHSLRKARSVKLEVQFNQLYEGTPLFGEIDLYLRERGFELWRLSELSHCGFEVSVDTQVPETFDYDSRRVEVRAGGGQLLWANAYYIRRETARLSQNVEWDDALRDACLAQAHHYSDLAEVSLRRSLVAAPREAHAVIHGAVNPPATAVPEPCRDVS